MKFHDVEYFFEEHAQTIWQSQVKTIEKFACNFFVTHVVFLSIIKCLPPFNTDYCQFSIRTLSAYHCNLKLFKSMPVFWEYIMLCLQQTYLQSLTVRLEEMRIKRHDSEQWMHHRLLPQELRERVRRYDQYKWLETRGVDEEILVQNLPKDLRRDIKRHLCLNLVRRVCVFNGGATTC